MYTRETRRYARTKRKQYPLYIIYALYDIYIYLYIMRADGETLYIILSGAAVRRVSILTVFDASVYYHVHRSRV